MVDKDQANKDQEAKGSEGVLSNSLKAGSSNVAIQKAATKAEREMIAKRTNMLARTSLSPYQIACLKNIPIKTIRQAWFTLSHLLLEPNSMIAVMGCGDGSFAYAMAVLNPDFHIIGLDSDRHQIMDAKKTWQLTNLEFVVSKVNKPSFPNNSLDAVVDSFTLHEIYSKQGFSEERVYEMLESHFELLKKNGLLFLRDYSHPPPGEYVMMEMPDIDSYGDEPEELSEADLLVRFSQEARSSHNEARGFFLEELEPYFERTRLFRLPYKWAYEFILRKNNRETWEDELYKEYTLLTPREMRKTLRKFEARVIYTAPYWDQEQIRTEYEGHFRLYDDDGQLLGYPATSHIFLARKVSEGESISLQERRPSHEPVQHLTFQSVRNKATGGIIDLVSRDVEIVEFLPYRISDTGRLHIFVHEGMPRAITNAVPRSGRNIDGKRWSGHMIEAIGVDRMVLAEYDDYWSPESTQDFTLRHLGLRPTNNAVMEQGPEFYPNPSMIDERIETKFVNVQKSRRSLTPRWVSQITKSFTDKGQIREFDAQHILNAINVGVIPSARLERQILALFAFLGIAADNWAETPLYLQQEDIPYASYQDLLAILNDDSKHFEKTNEFAGNIRSLHSYFVDEGYQDGTVKGLASRDIEFVIQENKTVNTAVVLPLMKSMSGEVLAGYIQEYLPVPERMGKNSKNLRAPSFNLPPDVKNMDEAKAYIAMQFSVNPDNVISLGESYFIHNGMTPQRVFPFAVTESIHGAKGPGGTFTEYAPIRFLWILQWHLFEESFALTMKRALERMHVDIDYGINRNIGLDTGQEHALWATPPPIGMPIPSSVEEHEAIAAEYRTNNIMNSSGGSSESSSGSSSGGGRRQVESQNTNSNSTAKNIKQMNQFPRGKFNPKDTGTSDTSGSSDSSSSSSSGGGAEQSKPVENQETKQSKKIEAPAVERRRFQNIDYSAIDGDREKQAKETSNEKTTAAVVSLRPPPARKVPYTPDQADTSSITPSNDYDDEMEMDMDMEDDYDDENGFNRARKKTDDSAGSGNGTPDIPEPEL